MPAMKKEIPFSILTQFADRLLAVSAFGDRNTRENILGYVPAIKKRAARSDKDQDDVMAIISAASDLPNGVAVLIDVIHYYEGDSLPMKAVWETVPHFMPFLGDQAVSLKRIGELLTILSNIPFPENHIIEQCCRDSLPYGYDGLPENPARLEIIHTLCTFEKRVKNHPLRKFAELLAEQRADLRRALENWAAECGLKAPETVKRRYHLMVIVEEKDIMSNAVNPAVRVWKALGSDDGMDWPPVPEWEIPETDEFAERNDVFVDDNGLNCRLRDLELLLPHFIDRIRGDAGKRLHTLEFFVPGKQLFLESDIWPLYKRK